MLELFDDQEYEKRKKVLFPDSKQVNANNKSQAERHNTSPTFTFSS
jgi:hypothetical protein